MKKAAIVIACGLICVGIGAINIWAGILALPILYAFSSSLIE
jgi:hypothetical protein